MRSSQLILDAEHLRETFQALVDWCESFEGYLVSPHVVKPSAADDALVLAAAKLKVLIGGGEFTRLEHARIVDSRLLHERLGGDVWLFSRDDERRLLHGAGALCATHAGPVVATLVTGQQFDTAISHWTGQLRRLREVAVSTRQWQARPGAFPERGLDDGSLPDRRQLSA